MGFIYFNNGWVHFLTSCQNHTSDATCYQLPKSANILFYSNSISEKKQSVIKISDDMNCCSKRASEKNSGFLSIECKQINILIQPNS